jgi:nucleotide-binding universal stress UspA family protein
MQVAEGLILLKDQSADTLALASMLGRAGVRPGVIVVSGPAPGAERHRIQTLVRGARVPVAVAPHGYADRSPGTLRRIGVAFDGWTESRAALAEGTRLAESAGAELVLLMVGDPHTAASALVGEAEDDWLLGHSEAATRYLEPVVADMPESIHARGAVLYGQVVPALSEAAKDDRLDLLVLGSRRQGPVARVALGSVSASLLRDPPCPLLICPRAGA